MVIAASCVFTFTGNEEDVVLPFFFLLSESTLSVDSEQHLSPVCKES